MPWALARWSIWPSKLPRVEVSIPTLDAKVAIELKGFYLRIASIKSMATIPNPDEVSISIFQTSIGGIGSL